MADYSALAEKLRGDGRASELEGRKAGIDLAAFYRNVKDLIGSEAEKANIELRKRELPLIERIFIPSFQGKLSMTFGTALLCCVDLNEEKQKISAVLFGPPNRCEISRKEFFLSAPSTDWSAAPGGVAVKTAVGHSPEGIAADIVSGIIMGEFS